MTVDLSANSLDDAKVSSLDELTPPNPDAVIEQLHALVASSNLNVDPATIQIRASALFARLKALNRAANTASRGRKQATTDARNEMDRTHLGLQNLQYEKRHLEREIEKCRQFASIYQDVTIHPLEEFLELASEDLKSTQAMKNEHQLMLNRLSFELSERQRLDQKLKELTQQKEELLKRSKTQLTTMDNVKLQIDVLMKTAADIQKKVEEMVQTT